MYTAYSIPGSEWPEYRRDDERTGDNVNETKITEANVAQLTLKWSHPVVAQFPESLVVNGVVYIADNSGTMQAIDLSMGSTIWTYSDRSINGSGLVGTPSTTMGCSTKARI